MKCEICGKFMELEIIYDFTSYYRCIHDCNGLVEDSDSEIRNMDYADKINKIFKYKLKIRKRKGG